MARSSQLARRMGCCGGLCRSEARRRGRRRGGRDRAGGRRAGRSSHGGRAGQGRLGSCRGRSRSTSLGSGCGALAVRLVRSARFGMARGGRRARAVRSAARFAAARAVARFAGPFFACLFLVGSFCLWPFFAGCSSRGRSSRWRPAPRCSCAGARASRRPGFCRPAPPALGCVAPAPCGWRPAPCDSGPAPWDPCSATRWACPGFGVRLAGAPATGWARSGLARAGALPSIAMQARSAAGSRCRRGVACGRCPRGSLTIAESAPINSSGPRVPACERGPPRASRRSRTLHRARRTRRSSAPARSRRRSRSAYGDRGAG